MNLIHLLERFPINRRLPPLNALRCFEAAARLGSFNQAAEELFVTPSAISHQIKSLEDFLGIRLFRREKRRIQMTVAGERYLRSVEHALDEIEIATRRLIAAPNATAINLSVVPAFLTRWLVPRIRQFQEQYSDVELRLSSSTGLVDFDHSDIDMAIYFGRGEWNDVEMHFLRNAIFVPVCSPKLLESNKPLKSLDDLANQTLIHVAGRQDEWEQMLRKAGISRSSIHKQLTFSSTSLAMNAAMEGLGVALADLVLTEREVQYGQLVIPFDPRLENNKAFYLVYQQGRQLTPAMQIFFDWLLAEIAKEKNRRLADAKPSTANDPSKT
jgi:LysR family glycine cleavage system transcriptional activator